MNYINTLSMIGPENTKIWTYLRKKLHHMAAFFCALVAGASPVQAEWLIRSGTGLYWAQPDAVNAAVDQFLGRPPGGGDGGTTTQGLGAAVDANGPVRLRRHAASALGWRADMALHPRLDLVGSVRLEYAHTRWFVKDGVSVLRDDLTANIRHIGLTPALALRTALPVWRGWQTDLSAGVGADVIWTRTRITSALLDVHRNDRFSESFVFTRVGLGHAMFPADRAVIDLEWRDSIDFSMRLGLEHRF